MKKADKERLVSFIEPFKEKHTGICVASGVVVGVDNSKYHMNKVCHAFLCSPGVDEPIGVISGFQHRYGENPSHGPGDWKDTTQQEKLLYLDWLMKRSPYKEAFLFKSPKRALKDMCVVVRGECHAPVLAAALVATRRLWEHTSVAIVFCELVKRGVPENLAYYLGHLACFTKGRKGPFDWGMTKAGHCTLDSHLMGKENVKQFVLGAKAYVGHPYCQNQYYDGYGDRMFGASGTPFHRYIRDKFPYKPMEDKPVANANPFLAAKKVEEVKRACSFKYAMDKMAEWYPTVMKEIGVE